MSAPTGPQTATVTQAPVGRALRIRPNRGASDAPATLTLGAGFTPAVGDQVLFTVVGRQLIVSGGA